MLSIVISSASVVVTVGIAMWMRHYLPAYLSEKAKNLATKEDVEALTHKVEGVKLLYHRAGAASEAQFAAEFKTYQEIWEFLIDVQRAVTRLRPMIDSGLAAGETKEQRQQARLKEFGESFNRFTHTYWARRPFYPEEVFKELEALAQLVHGEAIDYQFGEPGRDADYWRQARDNGEKMLAQVDRICDAIRTRLGRVSVA